MYGKKPRTTPNNSFDSLPLDLKSFHLSNFPCFHFILIKTSIEIHQLHELKAMHFIQIDNLNEVNRFLIHALFYFPFRL